MFKNDNIRFCLGEKDLRKVIESDLELKRMFDSFNMKPDVVLECLRNYMGHYVTTDFEVLDLLREKLSGFFREEFDFLAGGVNVCCEEQLKRLISFGVREICEDTRRDVYPELLRMWGAWFFYSDGIVSNEIYDTYDFETSENIIMYIIENIGLPPMQKEYAKYFLMMRGQEAYISDFEMQLIKAAGRSLVRLDEKICKLLNELLKS